MPRGSAGASPARGAVGDRAPSRAASASSPRPSPVPAINSSSAGRAGSLRTLGAGTASVAFARGDGVVPTRLVACDGAMAPDGATAVMARTSSAPASSGSGAVSLLAASSMRSSGMEALTAAAACATTASSTAAAAADATAAAAVAAVGSVAEGSPSVARGPLRAVRRRTLVALRSASSGVCGVRSEASGGSVASPRASSPGVGAASGRWGPASMRCRSMAVKAARSCARAASSAPHPDALEGARARSESPRITRLSAVVMVFVPPCAPSFRWRWS